MNGWWELDPDINQAAHERSYASIGQLMLHEKSTMPEDVYESLLKYWDKVVGEGVSPEEAIKDRIGDTDNTKEKIFSNWRS